MQKMILPLLLLFHTVTGCGSVPDAEGKQKPDDSSHFRIVGYYLGPAADVEKYDYAQLTHVIFCFTQLNGNGIAFEDSLGEKTLRRLVEQKKKHPQLKVMVALGGWSGCKTCASVFSTDADRIAFARSVKAFLVRYNLDGFDLDWESPVLGGKYGGGSPQDKANFTALIEALRKELPSPLELSFDANSFRDYVLQAIDWQAVMPQVDFVNLMTYGLPNDQPGHTGHHTALHSSVFQKESVESGVTLLDSLGLPLQKVVIGAGFYGFVVKEVGHADFGLGQAGKKTGEPMYKDILSNYTPDKGYLLHWDSTARAPYLYSAEEKTFITFDNEESCRLKTEYALRKKLGGIMFWRINGDLDRQGLMNAIYQESLRHR